MNLVQFNAGVVIVRLLNREKSAARTRSLRRLGIAGLSAATVAGLFLGGALARSPLSAVTDVQRGPPSLKGISPLPPETRDYIVDIEAAQQLGKAFFWDTQASSDGTACASCHFHAGADVRSRHAVNPGLVTGSATPNAVSATTSVSRAENQPGADNFPFHKLSDPDDRESSVVFDTTAVLGSTSSFAGDFVSGTSGVRAIGGQAQHSQTSSLDQKSGIVSGITTGSRKSEGCELSYSPYEPSSGKGSPFHSGGLIYRRVEPRHSPTTINAAFNVRQFWDGRANAIFNGVDPFGPRSYASLFRQNNSTIGNAASSSVGILEALAGDEVKLARPLIRNSSLASQAVAPPMADYEIACAGKTLADLGRKLLPKNPLSTQLIDIEDSLFGKTAGLVNRIALPGLNTTYSELVKKAFNAKYWSARGRYSIEPQSGAVKSDVAGYTQVEQNFSLFWGLAIQAYEGLLISDDAPYDRGPAAMTPGAINGQDIFMGRGKCFGCHSGPLFSNATITKNDPSSSRAIDVSVFGDGRPAVLDQGFYNTGVRPTSEDRGLGGVDAFGFDLSYTRQYKWKLIGTPRRMPDLFDPKPCSFLAPLFRNCDVPPIFDDPASAPRDAVDGAFKVPTLRNVGLTPPYFHNGGQSTLKDVVRFYNRGGDRRGSVENDSTGLRDQTPFGVVNHTNLAPDVGEVGNATANNTLGLSEAEMDNLVEFLLSLTDQRVACHSGVFDHPALPLVIGQEAVLKVGTQRAKDIIGTLPAVGKEGLKTCFPNQGSLFGLLQSRLNQIIK